MTILKNETNIEVEKLTGKVLEELNLHEMPDDNDKKEVDDFVCNAIGICCKECIEVITVGTAAHHKANKALGVSIDESFLVTMAVYMKVK